MNRSIVTPILTIGAAEFVAVLAILSVGFLSSQPKPVIPIDVSGRESEQMTQACDEAGGEWHEGTMKEMQRTLTP